jgi:putative GTP pyrophosphokinase
MKVSALRRSYDETLPDAVRFLKALEGQISEMIRQASLSLAVPVESRIKAWPSVVAKVDRLSLRLDHIKGLSDLIGLRLVFLFSEHAARASGLIAEHFKVISQENTGDRLKAKEFGYQSVHFIVRVMPTWTQVPTLRDFESFQAEIQVRTLSQHTWAVSSRVLQYNQEAAVPVSLQRSLYRLAALLELVDLELERISKDKERYSELMRRKAPYSDLDSELDVDQLVSILDHCLPESHRQPHDAYAELFFDLRRQNIVTGKTLVELVNDYLPRALKDDAAVVVAVRAGDPSYSGDQDKIDKGVFYSHVGLVQKMLNLKFGMKWREEEPE